MEIVTKEIILHSLTTIDLRYWIASQCIKHNFSRSILKRLKTQVERTVMAPRFKIDTSIHVHNFQDLFRTRSFLCVVLYYNDLVVGFQCLIRECEKQSLRFPINRPGI